MNDSRICHIEDIKDERVALYTEYNEPQLFHLNEPGSGVFIAETPMVIERAIISGARPLSFFVESDALNSGEVQRVIGLTDADIAIFEAKLSVINRITGFNLTRGMLAVFERPHLSRPEEILRRSSKIAVLEDIVNPTNVGAIFRSSAALGADGILLTSASADPFYRRSARVSMGTVFMIPWTYIPKGTDLTALLRNDGYTIISMAISDDAIPLTDPVLKEGTKRAVIFGSEGDGISRDTLSGSDHIAVIPMHNEVDSLNVAASSAVTFWELFGK
ncbi:MAG: RNA methyltransferase [Lachnospiraceae bacterium]|nr:RNA methyltransferase [Lachnospiraceae bacterium]